MSEVFRREIRVALSKKAQPVWFRVLKWVIFLGISALLYPTGFLWVWIVGMLGMGLGVHMIYRHKTHGWTHPWGMWNDVEAGRVQNNG